MAHARVVMELGDRVVALGTVGHEVHCHLGLVDDLALLQRAARRLGWSIRLRQASPELAELLELAGLADVLHTGTPPAPDPGPQTDCPALPAAPVPHPNAPS